MMSRFRSAEPPLVPNLTELEEFYSIQALTQLLNQRLIDLAGQMAGKVLEWAPGEERWCEGVRAFDIQAACTPGSEKAIIKVLFNEIARLKKHTINQFDYDVRHNCFVLFLAYFITQLALRNSWGYAICFKCQRFVPCWLDQANCRLKC
jgi:hypothetical protein